MAATRLMQLGVSSHSSSSSGFSKSKLIPLAARPRRLDGAGGGEMMMKEKQTPAPGKAYHAVSERRNSTAVVSERDEVKWGWSDHLIALLSNIVTNESILVLKKIQGVVIRRRSRTPTPTTRKKLFHVQMFLEKGIMDCRFFTIFAVAGSLLASFLCFLEGCFLIIESYVHYFNSLSTLDHYQGHVVHLLIEALDMFLMGTGMLVFAMGLHTLFVGSRQTTSGTGSTAPQQIKEVPESSNLLGFLYLKSTESSWVGMKTVEEAKARIGHAIMLMLQVGMIEKFKDIPLVNGMDMASFAAALFLSSASVFLLSKLSRKQTNNNNIKPPFFFFH